ncbi:MAG: hypothetical protein D9V47_07680 [Clostridia bacterium]|nr:MAG: hypothetical protein D9V47_07680 [Clostridia bacterium]
MAVEFRNVQKVSRFLDPRQDFAETKTASEIRFDPLTGRTGRVAHFALPPLTPPDLEEMARLSLERGCPFCPDLLEKVTPMFPSDLIPEGRLHRGEATVIPNLSPYDEHSALTVMSRQHLVRLPDFTLALLTDAFSLSLEYFHRVYQGPPSFPLINWNYFPPSGGSQLHPHLQLFATDTPGNLLLAEIQASERYYREEGRNFWEELVVAEKAEGKRYLGQTGEVSWMVSYVPIGILGDVVAVFPQRSTLAELTPGDLEAFSDGLTRVFRYFHDQGMYSFNLAFYPGRPGEADRFWVHARTVPRFSVQPVLHASDVNTLQYLYDEPVTMIWPEAMAAGLKPYFA